MITLITDLKMSKMLESHPKETATLTASPPCSDRLSPLQLMALLLVLSIHMFLDYQ
jgi:hypothetical protein